MNFMPFKKLHQENCVNLDPELSPEEISLLGNKAPPLETVSQFLPVIASDQRERGNPFNFDVLQDCFVAWGSSQ
jgi:hypothetical protein